MFPWVPEVTVSALSFVKIGSGLKANLTDQSPAARLQAVRGIGPRLAARLEPYLVFSERDTLAGDAAPGAP